MREILCKRVEKLLGPFWHVWLPRCLPIWGSPREIVVRKITACNQNIDIIYCSGNNKKCSNKLFSHVAHPNLHMIKQLFLHTISTRGSTRWKIHTQYKNNALTSNHLITTLNMNVKHMHSSKLVRSVAQSINKIDSFIHQRSNTNMQVFIPEDGRKCLFYVWWTSKNKNTEKSPAL